jgi:hypothetical protein
MSPATLDYAIAGSEDPSSRRGPVYAMMLVGNLFGCAGAGFLLYWNVRGVLLSVIAIPLQGMITACGLVVFACLRRRPWFDPLPWASVLAFGGFALHLVLGLFRALG